MTTTSFPLSYVEGGPDANISHAQWRQLFSRAPGYYDPDENGMNLTLSSTDDTATVSTGKYGFKGFALRVTAAHGLTLAAAVGSAKTYSIGIMYDPAKESDPAGPLYLAAPLKTGIATATPSGGDFETLYEVTRQPSQVLSQAVPIDLRTWAYGAIFRATDATPDPAAYAYGQVLVQTNPTGTFLLDLLVRRGGSDAPYWQSLTAPSWAALSLPSGITATGSTAAQWGRSAGKIELAGLVKRSSGALFVAGTEYTVSTQFGGAYAPHQPRRFFVDSGFNGSGSGARCFVSSAGVVTVRAPYDTDVISLDGVAWHPKGS